MDGPTRHTSTLAFVPQMSRGRGQRAEGRGLGLRFQMRNSDAHSCQAMAPASLTGNPFEREVSHMVAHTQAMCVGQCTIYAHETSFCVADRVKLSLKMLGGKFSVCCDVWHLFQFQFKDTHIWVICHIFYIAHSPHTA